MGKVPLTNAMLLKSSVVHTPIAVKAKIQTHAGSGWS